MPACRFELFLLKFGHSDDLIKEYFLVLAYICDDGAVLQTI